MDDAISSGGNPLERLKIAERAEQGFPTCGSQGLGLLLGPDETGDFVASRDQLRDKG